VSAILRTAPVTWGRIMEASARLRQPSAPRGLWSTVRLPPPITGPGPGQHDHQLEGVVPAEAEPGLHMFTMNAVEISSPDASVWSLNGAD
jgi:hypothetical protein